MQAIVLVCNQLSPDNSSLNHCSRGIISVLRYKINFFSSYPQMIKDFFFKSVPLKRGVFMQN